MADEPEEVEATEEPAEPDFTRRVITRRGSVVEFDTPEEAAEALSRTDRSGRPMFTPDSPEAREERRLQRVYGDRPIAAGLAGAARGATFGLSDAAGAALGFREDLDELDRRNQAASVLGDVVGSIAPVLISGPLGAAAEAGRGATLVGRGARLLTAPTRAVAGLAESGGAAVSTALRGAGTTALRRTAGTVGRLVTEGAIEGGFGEAGRILTEHSLGRDPDLTAEALLARIGSGAMFGAGGGAILGTGGAAIGEAARASRRAASGAADMMRRAWRESVGTELSPSVARVAAYVSGADPASAARYLSVSPEGRSVRELIRRGDDVYDDGTRAVASSLDALERGRAHGAAYWTHGLKRDQISRRIAPGRLLDQAGVAEDGLRAVRAFTDRVLPPGSRVASGDYAAGTGAVARELRRVLDAHDATVAAAASRAALGWNPNVSATAAREAATDIFQALDDIKRRVARARLTREVRGTVAAAELNQVHDAIRLSLERSDLWGEAADVQRVVNRAFTTELDTRDAFSRRFLGGDGTRDDIDAFNRLQTTDTRTINSFLRQAGTVANETAEGTFEGTIGSTRNLLRTLDEHLDLPPNVRADIRAALAGSDTALQTFARVRNEATELNQWRRFEGAQNSTARSIMAAVLGNAAGGPIAAAALSALASPAIAVRSLGTIERMTGGLTDQVGQSVRAFIRRSGGATVDVAREGARRGRLAAGMGTEAYLARAQQLDEDRRNPRGAIERMAARVDGMEAAPAVRNALIRTAVRGTAYLSQHRPPQRAMTGQIRPDRTALPSTAEIAEFMRRVRAVDNPASIIADLRRGDVTPEAIDAVRQVYPKLFEEIRNTIVRELASDDRSIDYNQRVALGLLLGVPTDPALTPSHMALTQSLYAASAAAAVNTRPTARAPNVAANMASGVDALAARRTA